VKFYEVDDGLCKAITGANLPVRVKVEIESGGGVEAVCESDIISATFAGLRETAGGISSRGEVVLDNSNGKYSGGFAGPGAVARVSFSMGDGLPYFPRFTFRIDDRGIQDIRGPGRERRARIGLRDFSWRLRGADEARDWTAPAVFAYTVVCDCAQPDTSLVHLIAKRADINVEDIRCSTIPVGLPFARLRDNVWRELSSLAVAYRCHLECGADGKLEFFNSPYQAEPVIDDGVSHIFEGADIHGLRTTDRADLYRNTVRLKVNMPVSLSRREIWRYDQPPVIYDEQGRPRFPFGAGYAREIERGRHAAAYSALDDGGEKRPVVYADEVDDKTLAESRLEYAGGPFTFSLYDVDSSFDKAFLTMDKGAGGYLFSASIHGRPIVLDLNRSCFLRDEASVAANGTLAVNATGRYFSEHDIGGGTLHYVDWTRRELALLSQRRREFTVRTHQALFNARVGARVKIRAGGKEAAGALSAFSLFYKRDAAFVSTFRVMEILETTLPTGEGR